MYPKLLAVIVFIALLALGTLVIRQQRLEAMHKIVRSHAQINHDRQAIWDYQVRIAGKLDPESLAKAAERQGLRLRPMIDAPVLPDMPDDIGTVGPEDGRFVNNRSNFPNINPRPVNEVTMVQVSAGSGIGASADQKPIMIPVVDPEPNTRQQPRITPRR
jgi:hypothetical protein